MKASPTTRTVEKTTISHHHPRMKIKTKQKPFIYPSCHYLLAHDKKVSKSQRSIPTNPIKPIAYNASPYPHNPASTLPSLPTHPKACSLTPSLLIHLPFLLIPISSYPSPHTYPPSSSRQTQLSNRLPYPKNPLPYLTTLSPAIAGLHSRGNSLPPTRISPGVQKTPTILPPSISNLSAFQRDCDM